MVFSSTTFLFLFLPLVLIGYFAAASIGRRNTVLLIASLLFYAWGEGAYLLIMLASIGVNFALSRQMDRQHDRLRRKHWLTAELVFNLGLLAFFKYANFLTDNLNDLLDGIGLPLVYLAPIHLPIGISFFTFQAIAYVLDVYWRKIPAQGDVFKLGLYIALFPQLIAGPIVRYTQIREALDERANSVEERINGIQRFIIGLAKKMLIADTLGRVADQIFALPATELEPSAAWLGILAYTVQIYYDFSGYSDMAIGLGQVFGFRFPENFNYPYISRSLREFWRRWHISLSTWFRDYLYIPLGGNHGSTARTFFNLGLVFFLCGLWHGASWNFIVWGLFHGCFLILERTAFGAWLSRRSSWIQHFYLLAVVIIAWVFFRAADISQAIQYLGAMIGQAGRPAYYAGLYLDREILLSFVFAITFAGPLFPYLQKRVSERGQSMQALYLSLLMGLFLWSLTTILTNSYQPFIYFRF
ncbi:MBOAT family O-acyltransferase [Flavilitoribacter nigricans]|uniref:Membrane-bound O-acyltransferase family protein n=1 Tax=Flavilitoribacter nigricans (strain ATCC 23147 / DSM 23189 / NBRC 102662 / NCIMB 1420 / SS-2) TaxID=1122177 RepID=A0A2D0N896_FLAN2|nr:MBOAT family O-acyltransferase [Flavilitoribacter nigricans]PHN04732.1 membrane-bound O-acyltransferase family protein [Flavilitoribacter nigricans DSM 23189 = NBRC 102662]